jgi:septation ring formation regulator EzrA
MRRQITEQAKLKLLEQAGCYHIVKDVVALMVSDIGDDIDDLQEDLDEAKAEAEKWEEKHDELREEVYGIASTLKDIEIENEEMQQQLNDLIKDLENL